MVSPRLLRRWYALGLGPKRRVPIDSIAQSWAVLSGAGDPVRARQAMKAVDRASRPAPDRLILLFTPPFDDGSLDPGYIKGYLPGVRENGGQYTHAATWVVQAVALLGQGRLAFEMLQMIEPHPATPRNRQGVERYRVEPYVLAGDVYSRTPHVGRGGWTWYTGSASWFYRAILESILGFQHRGDRLFFQPCIPPEWSHFEITYRFRSTNYTITVENPEGAESGSVTVWLDKALQAGNSIPLADDGSAHEVRVVLGQT